MANKGPPFERWACEQLSLWWSNGTNDCMFWRTSGSGARATTRSKKGKKTVNHYGDITAIDPDGQPLIDCITFEAKRGYSKNTLIDLLDKSDSAKEQQWEEWIRKTIASHKNAGSFSWAIVSRRDRREPIIAFPSQLALKLSTYYYKMLSCDHLILNTTIENTTVIVVVVKLKDFFAEVKPEIICKMMNDVKGNPTVEISKNE